MDSQSKPGTRPVPSVPAPPQSWGAGTQAGACSTLRPIDDRELPGLIHFNRALRELEMAVSVDEVKQIRDKAEAMRIYARQATYSLEMQNMCAEIKLRAERRLGEMLSETGVSKSKNNNLLRGRSVQLRENTPSLAELGISKSQSSRWQLIGGLDAEVFEKRIEETKSSGKELTSRDMADYARYLQREQARASELQSSIQAGDSAEPDHQIKILMGDFREVLTESLLATDSVDLVLTDPPYGEEYLPLWKELSCFAARILKPGRLLVSYSGNYHLEKVIRLVCEHLQYVWTAAVMNGTPPDTVFPRKIMTYWKPVLLFSKGDYRPLQKREWFRDRIDGDGRVKTHHAWEQGVGEARHLVEALTHEGHLIVDPFVGSGTTGVACKQLNRRFLGSDLDEKSVRIAQQRINEGR